VDPVVVAWLAALRATSARANLVESSAVREKRLALGQLMNQLGAQAQRNDDAGVSMPDALTVPYVQSREQINKAGKALSATMKADLAFAPDE
jgi:hypothetical protein